MIFLITKMFVYLLVSLGLGAAAGWLWRHQQAAAREAEMERQLMETRSRFPQVETALRTREQQIEGLLEEVHARDEALAEQTALATERDRTVATLERSCAELRQQLDSLQAAAPVTADTGSDDELELHPGDPAAQRSPADAVSKPEPDAEPAEPAVQDQPAAPAEVAAAEAAAAEAAAEAAVAEAARVDDGEFQRLADALEDARQDLERARAALAAEQRRVAELTQERALQHRALAALEQQLEMVRDDGRAASG